MIFPSESLYELRSNLAAKMDSGEISEEEGFRQALQADPDDSAALRFLGLEALATGNLADADRYARELIRTHPNGHLGYLMLGTPQDPESVVSPLQVGYLLLALEKVLFDNEACDSLDLDSLTKRLGAADQVEGSPKDEGVFQLLEELRGRYESDLETVSHELQPYQLIHELREYREDVLASSTVDGILEHAAKTGPLLLGILKEFAENLLTEADYSMVERAIALLGEMGDPATLPVLLEFLVREEEDVSGPADWAFRRIAFQHPAEALARMEAMIPGAKGAERVALAQQIAMMPGVPGRSAALSSLTVGLSAIPEGEQEAVVISAIAGALLTEGEKSVLATSLERQFSRLFSKVGRADLRTLHKEMAGLGPEEATEDELSIHDICCREPYEDGDEEDPDVDAAIAPPRPGRNDPCWCGSGKKYKKCHLDEDGQR